MFHIATEQDIINGKVTDVYFVRTRQILEAEKVNKTVKAEFIVKEFPHGRKWGVLTGIDDACNLLKGKPLNVRGMKEGTIFREYEAVMTIEGKYLDFGIYETALLGLLCQSSGIATKAARCKKSAGERAVISFGSRRMHPALAPMIERNAFLGGCDGVSVVESAEDLGIEPTWTIPHALVLLMGDTVRAIQAFHKVIDKKVKRVALIDTFEDEKFGALNAAGALGKDL
ncbi:MAG: nicotinate phosphoribosyltransferase, partial [Candidatus Omnitrophica bacterium]|nr:nicotinate phosphoribosyltransferase [Candidatus Omnitrophota bacterium]